MPDAVVIAVDGPAASGKGTISKLLAQHFKLQHLDTGLLYRAVGLAMLQSGGDLDDPSACEAVAKKLDLTALDPDVLAQHHVGEAASKVAVHPPLRAALLEAQRSFANVEPGAVLDGRDIGTVVCPGAQAKLFITASLEARAKRRHAQAVQKDPSASLEAISADLAKRDARDAGRSNAPLAQANDALLLDTTNLGIDAAFEAARAFVASKLHA
ncbi:(d)CMP kinase [Ahrensia marina]|uniref:(d)CMP kinase n=1 Tax=Ahrensia marina TaxID=1514904 RepID=UPI0035D06461